jgi:peroxiredoxin
MGKAARLRAERRVAPPPPIRKKNEPVRQTTIWIATGGLVALVAIVAVALLATRSTPKVAAPASATAADRAAPAALVQAADQVGFHPTTEPGVGQVEGRPASAASPPANPNLLPVGSVAPGFTLRTPQGKKVSLGSYRGRTVLLEFFATWCPHCNAEEPHLTTLARSLEKRGVRLLAVNADGETAPSVFAFHRYYGIQYPALVDPGASPGSFNAPGSAGTVSTAYRVESFPTFYVIRPNGKIAWRSDGEQPDALLRSVLLNATHA